MILNKKKADLPKVYNIIVRKLILESRLPENQTGVGLNEADILESVGLTLNSEFAKALYSAYLM